MTLAKCSSDDWRDWVLRYRLLSLKAPFHHSWLTCHHHVVLRYKRIAALCHAPFLRIRRWHLRHLCWWLCLHHYRCWWWTPVVRGVLTYWVRCVHAWTTLPGKWWPLVLLSNQGKQLAHLVLHHLHLLLHHLKATVGRWLRLGLGKLLLQHLLLLLLVKRILDLWLSFVVLETLLSLWFLKILLWLVLRTSLMLLRKKSVLLRWISWCVISLLNLFTILIVLVVVMTIHVYWFTHHLRSIHGLLWWSLHHILISGTTYYLMLHLHRRLSLRRHGSHLLLWIILSLKWHAMLNRIRSLRWSIHHLALVRNISMFRLLHLYPILLLVHI